MTKEELKEFKKLMKEAKKLMEELEDERPAGAFEEITDSMFKKAQKEPCKISIETDTTGRANVKVDGNMMSVLLALAGLEKAIIGQMKCPAHIWEIVKAKVGIEEE